MKRTKIILCLATFYLTLNVAYGLTIKPMNFEELVDASDLIFYGQVVSTEEGRSATGKSLALVTRFRVEETLKGEVSQDTFDMRQAARRGPRGKVLPLFHQNRFRDGERVLLFVANTSSAGFSAPVGFGQGIFRTLMQTKETGDPVLLNGFRNRGLFQRIQSKAIQSRMSSVESSPKEKKKLLRLSTMKDMIHAYRGVDR